MATLTSCGGAAVHSEDHGQAPDAEASKRTPKESLDYGDLTLAPLTSLQIKQYLDFLHLPTPSKADLQSLDALIAAHLERIPFQSIDTFLGHLESMEASAVFSKVVMEGRGGNCFELNSLFARLLLSLGYKVQVRCARIRWAVPEDHPQTPVDHMVLCVSEGGKEGPGQERLFLVDVGFGGPCPRRAVPLEGDATPYRLRTQDDDWAKPIEVSILNQAGQSSCWLPLYQVFAYSHEWPDFMDKSWYFATYPGVVFRDVLAVSRYEGDCWLTLRNRHFTRRRCTSSGIGVVTERRLITSMPDLLSLMDGEFKVKFDPDVYDKLRVHLQLL
nr:arylamine N-acetyltransferase-like [Dermacentor andersoni]